MKKITTTETGFTIIELLVATTVFAVILMGATYTLIQVARMYYRGVISSQTQEISRAVMDDISRSIQFSGEAIIPPVEATPGGSPIKMYNFCVGNTRYTYAFQSQVTNRGDYDGSLHQGPHALWRDTVTGNLTFDSCHQLTSPLDLRQPQPSPGGKELLGEHMRLSKFSLSQPDSANRPAAWTISMGIAYGDDALLTAPGNDDPGACLNQIGSQWCAFSELITTVIKRV